MNAAAFSLASHIMETLMWANIVESFIPLLSSKPEISLKKSWTMKFYTSTTNFRLVLKHKWKFIGLRIS